MNNTIKFKVKDRVFLPSYKLSKKKPQKPYGHLSLSLDLKRKKHQ